MRQTKLLYLVVALLVVSNLWFGVEYLAAQGRVRAYQTESRRQVLNERILAFTQLFVSTVLQAEREVDFETRLKLENAVREIQDSEVLAQWQKFTESPSEVDAQREVKTLLGLLLTKIKSP